MQLTPPLAAALLLCATLAIFASLQRRACARRVRRLERQQSLLLSLVSTFPESYCLLNRDGTIFDAAQEDAPWSGTPLVLVGKKNFVELLMPTDASRVLDGLRESLDRNRTVDLTCSVFALGAARSYECRFVPFERNVAVCFFRDATAVICREAELAKSLAEKEALLREINHRVNNNLQIITSFLHMQAEQFSSHEDREIAYDGLRRIQSLATIHELIYHSENVSIVPLPPFIGELVNSQAFALRLDPSLIEVLVDDLSVSVNRAFSLGLIVGEFSSVVIKSLAGADPLTERRASVSLRARGDSVILVFACVGVMPFSDQNLFDRGVMSCLLVPPLARELGGTLRCDSGDACSIEFPSYAFLRG